MKAIRTFGVLSVLFLTPAAAVAQAAPPVPFFFPGGVGGGVAVFDPEIDYVHDGAVTDVQAVVSADRKYVTLNMRATRADLIAIRQFQFQGGGDIRGFAGDPPAQAQAAGNRNNNGNGNNANGNNGNGNNGNADNGNGNGTDAVRGARGQAAAVERRAVRPSEVRGNASRTILQRQGMTLLNSAGAARRQSVLDE